MTIQPGARLGPYEIITSIGAGGMGEVWRAKDTRLDRDVAIKVLPPGFAENDDLLQRFEREAKAISQLNHPNVCTLFDVGHEKVAGSREQKAGGTAEGGGQSADTADPVHTAPSTVHYLVMEYLEGESLADRVKKGPLPLHEVLKVGQQIASALDAAHRRGITHRDLKPGNIMLTKSGAKLLDFGLAKTATEGHAPLDGLTNMPTEAKPLTTEGTILGTFQYMAPEQLEGVQADARTDIFALGALLYEMATGRRAFQGGSKTSLIAAIVSTQPAPISSVVAMTPPALDHVVRRCLEKDPDDRWQSAHDVAGQLQWISEAGSQAGAPIQTRTRRKSRERLAWALALLLAASTSYLAMRVFRAAPDDRRIVRASISPPPSTALIPFDELGLELSPDGTRLAFVANAADGGKQIWIRDLATMEAQPVAETEGAWYPFWSPDGQHLGFFTSGKLWRIDLRGGSPRQLAEAPSGRGGSWGRDDTILFTSTTRSAIYRVSATGGKPEAVTDFDPQREVTHRWPRFLPDGQHFLFVSRAAKGGEDIGRLMIGSIDSPDVTLLVDDASNAVFVNPGYLIYGRSATLFGQAFDAGKLVLTGDPVPIVDERLSFWEPKNYVVFTASDDGTIVYLPAFSPKNVLRWYDRQGGPRETIGEPAYQWDHRLSPDGRKIAFIRGESPNSQSDLWIHDLALGRSNRATFKGEAYATPEWSRDASQIAFLCQPKSVHDICVRRFDSAEVQVLVESPNWTGSLAWSSDGTKVVFSEQSPDTANDLWILDMENGGANGEPRILLQTPFEETSPRFSPSGGWISYESDETGRSEVYVRSTSGSPEQWQISTNGGRTSRWSGDGSEIFFTSPDGNLMAATVNAGVTIQPEEPVVLFRLPEIPGRDNPVFQDVSADGQRFLLAIPSEPFSSIGLHLVLNWTSLFE